MRHIGIATICIFIALTWVACTSADEDTVSEDAVPETVEQPAGTQEVQVSTGDDMDALAVQNDKENEAVTKEEWDITDKGDWTKDKGEASKSEGSVLERTLEVVEGSGGEVHYIEHPGRGERMILVTPEEFVDGETPLIVSLHGFGEDSAYQATYVPLHERVNTYGFALMLPNGIQDDHGSRFWNPTDECCEGGKSAQDDVAYLTELVGEARKMRAFGPVYFFGYSNGGFMAHHMACKGLPGLRGVASLAGTSYVEEDSCDGAPPVSVLHIHGTEDSVILFDGDESEPDPTSEGTRAFYVGAGEMVRRWSRQAGCEWPEDPQPYAVMDLDRCISGPETRMFRAESGCETGISIELWSGVGSGHAPGYGDAFVDALLDWILSQG